MPPWSVTHSVELGLDDVAQQSLARELHPHVELPVEVVVFHKLGGSLGDSVVVLEKGRLRRKHPRCTNDYTVTCHTAYPYKPTRVVLWTD
jgi:hypothetical protein